MPKQNSFAGAFWRAVFEKKNIVMLRGIAFLDLDFISKLELWAMGEAFQGVLPTSDMTSKQIVDKLFC